MRTRSRWCNLLTAAQGRVYTSTSAFRLHRRAIPLQPLTLPVARDRAPWGNYLSHDRYSGAISWNPFHGLTAEISWHTPASDSPPASWQLYCLVTWTKQHRCLTGRQNDNKLIFMNSLSSSPSVICFLYFYVSPFCRILRLRGLNLRIPFNSPLLWSLCSLQFPSVLGCGVTTGILLGYHLHGWNASQPPRQV